MKLTHHPDHAQRPTGSDEQLLPKPTRVLGFAIFAACLSVAWTQTVLSGVSGALPGGVLLCLTLPLLWRAFFPRP